MLHSGCHPHLALTVVLVLLVVLSPNVDDERLARRGAVAHLVGDPVVVGPEGGVGLLRARANGTVAPQPRDHATVLFQHSTLQGLHRGGGGGEILDPEKTLTRLLFSPQSCRCQRWSWCRSSPHLYRSSLAPSANPRSSPVAKI